MATESSQTGAVASMKPHDHNNKYRQRFEQALAWLRRPVGESTSSARQGLSWRLAEWCLAWLLMVGFALMYIIDYMHAWWEATTAMHSNQLHHIPLTTIPQTRSQRNLSFKEQMAEFQSLLKQYEDEDHFIMIDNVSNDNGDDVDDIAAEYVLEEEGCLLSMLRTNLRARRLASSIMSLWTCDQARSASITPEEKDRITIQNVHSDHLNRDSQKLDVTDNQAKLMLRLQRVWAKALEIPQTGTTPTETSPLICSIIIPAYKEGWDKIAKRLDQTHHDCSEPNQVEVIVIDAGGNQQDGGDGHDGLHIQKQSSLWGAWKIVAYKGSGGRGGCMNFGAEHAQGQILTFLHSDTLLPPNWDQSIYQVLLAQKEDDTEETRNHSNIGEKSKRRIQRNLMCAFSMGIESTSQHSGKSVIHTPGIGGADWFLGGVRCSLCKLPYGDSTLSFPSDIFWYLGGYPDNQPLMEDFALVRLVRQHAMVQILRSQSEGVNISQKKTASSWLFEKLQLLQQVLQLILTTQIFGNNGLVILKDRIACSPRRWQTLGVPYVVLSNAYIIYNYSQENATTEDLFEFYYRQKSLSHGSTADSKIHSGSDKARNILSHEKHKKDKES